MRLRTLAAFVLAVAVLISTPVSDATAARNFGPRGAEYVSIGDSYIAAGSLTTSYDCNAPDDVGHLVASQLPGVSFADWSCGGSITSDIYTRSGKGAQVEGLSARTKYVSVSTGGNDDDFFSDLATRCITSVLCTPATQRSAERKLDRLPGRLDAAYSAIRAHAPNAKVVVLGYLRALPTKAAGCFIDPIMGQRSVDAINRIQRRLNTIIGEAADRRGFSVVNLWSDAGHSICAPDGQRYVSLTGIGPGDYGTPVHPTMAGRLHTATLLAEAFKNQYR